MLTAHETKNPLESLGLTALSNVDRDRFSHLQSENNSLKRINAELQNRLDLLLRRAMARRIARQASM